MKAEEIRALQVTGEKPDSTIQRIGPSAAQIAQRAETNCLLREIAAQLAELNENMRSHTMAVAPGNRAA